MCSGSEEGGGAHQAAQQEEGAGKGDQLPRGAGPPERTGVPAGGRAEEQGDWEGRARGQATRESEPLPGRVGTAWARGAWGQCDCREQAHQTARKEVGKYGEQGHLWSCEGHMLQASVSCPAPTDTCGASGKLGNATQLLTRSRIFLAALLFSSCSTVSIVENWKISSVFIQGNTYTGAQINENHFCQKHNVA